jgi:apolipoprotein D and lipocalin family protein
LEPVTGFELERYLGKWYEIARLDHSFEKNMTNVSAYYALRDDGGISVVNQGFHEKKEQWKTVEGRAYLLGARDVGSLKVSFFGPFYGGYHIICLDKNEYSYAMVTGPKRSYLWILAREKSLAPHLLSDLIGKAKNWGYNTEDLIFVVHDRLK